MWQKIKCIIGLHVYYPSYSQRQWRTSKGRHCYSEFQMKCNCCGKKTRWIRLSKYDEFTKTLGSRYGWKN